MSHFDRALEDVAELAADKVISRIDDRVRQLVADALGGGAAGTFLSTREVAAETGLSVATLENWRTRGIGPQWVKAGSRRVLYRRDELDRWLKSGRRETSR